MKKALYLTVSSILLFSLFSTAVFAADSNSATVNGKEITLTTAPFISEEGSTCVPLRSPVKLSAQKFRGMVIIGRP